MDKYGMKFVDFEKYCRECEHVKRAENESPCWECLEHPTNFQSEKPVCFKGSDEK